jgi:hypothetical protein
MDCPFPPYSSEIVIGAINDDEMFIVLSEVDSCAVTSLTMLVNNAGERIIVTIIKERILCSV